MSYKSEHGDVFLYGDTARQQLAYNIHGVNYSVQPNSWFMSDGNRAVLKGSVIALNDLSVYNTPTVVGADQESVTSIIGVALNGVSAVVPVEYTTDTPTSVNPYVLTGLGVTAGIEIGYLVQGKGIPRNTLVTFVDTDTITISNAIDLGTYDDKVWVGVGVEVASEGNFNFDSIVFAESEVGSALYMSPIMHPTYEEVGTLGNHPQLTTVRSYAATSGQPLMEIGIVSSVSSMHIDVQGDVRGATGLTQITVNAGETIYNDGTPKVVSIGNDGYAYVSDKRKAYSDLPAVLSVLSNDTGAMLSSFTYPKSTIYTFSVLSGSSSGTTLTWGESWTGTITIPGIMSAVEIATLIATSTQSGWVVTSEGSYVKMVYLGTGVAPTLTSGGSGVTLSVIAETSSYEMQSQLTVLSSTTTGGSIVLSSGNSITIAGSANIQTIANAIATSFSGNTRFSVVSDNISTVTFTQISYTNRNTPAGFLVGANSGYSGNATHTVSSAISGAPNITKIAYSSNLNRYIGIVSGTSTSVYKSDDGLTWTTVTGLDSNTYSDIQYLNGQFLLVASASNRIYYSDNGGTTWSYKTLTSSSRAWLSVAYSSEQNLYVVISSEKYVNIATPPTVGGNLSTVSSFTEYIISSPNSLLNKIVWVSELSKFIISSTGSTTSSHYSTTGLSGNSWTSVTTTGISTTGLNSLTYGSKSKMFVAISGTGVYISKDGYTWTAQNVPVVSWKSVAYSYERNEFMVISDGVDPVVYTSSYGTSWTALTMNTAFSGTYTLSSMVWASSFNQYIIVGKVSSVTSAHRIYPSGIITAGTPCMVHKIGSLSTIIWTGLQSGQPVYLDTNGGFTTDPQSINYYSDTLAPLGYVSDTKTVYVNIGEVGNKGYSVPIGSMKAMASDQTVPDYGWLKCDGSSLLRSDYQDLFAVIGTTYGSEDETHFTLPALAEVYSIPLQIKYKLWYSYNPTNAPMFRVDTGWNTWGTLPSMVTTGTASQYMEIPASAFGNNIQLSDVFVEVYVQKSANNQLYCIDPTPVVSPTGTQYGYQIQQDTTGSIRLNFCKGGLAYYDRSQSVGSEFVAIDNTWEYRVLVYQTNRFNTYIDVTADTKVQQLWNLGLTDMTSAYNSKVDGQIYRGTTDPSHTTRLNYDGKLYTYQSHVVDTLDVGGNTVVSGDLAVNGGDITTANTSASLFNTTATALNIGGEATTVNIGASTGTASIKNTTVELTNATSFTATKASTINIGTASTGDTTFNLGVADLTNTVNINGNTPKIIAGTVAQTVELFNTSTGTISAFGAATTINIGKSTATTSTVTVNGKVVLGSSSTDTLTLNGTINSNIRLDDTNRSILVGLDATNTNRTLTINNGNSTKSVDLVLDGDIILGKAGSNTSPKILTASGILTGNIFNTTATTVNIGGAATILSIGASSGTATINNATFSLPNATALNATKLTSVSLGTSELGATTIDIGTAATTSGIKAINIGTSGTTGSTTTITIGTTAGTTPTITLNGVVKTSTNIYPVTNDTGSLGISGKAYSDLYLGSGGVINFGDGNVALTHSSSVLTVGTGDLRITTAGTATASVVTVGGTQTLTGKTLTDPIINNIVSSVAADLWSENTTTAITIGNGITTGSVSIAGALTNGQVNIANGTGAITDSTTAVNILSGAQTGAYTRTLNLGANGGTNVTTVINIGTSATTTANINIGTASKSTITIPSLSASKVVITNASSQLTTTTSSLTLSTALTVQTGAVTLTGNVAGSSIVLPTSGTMATLAGVETLTNKKLGDLTTNGVVFTSGSNGTLNSEAILSSLRGGTGNGFTKFSGPTTTERTYTLPNQDATLLYVGRDLGTPSGGILTSCSGLPAANIATGSLPSGVIPYITTMPGGAATYRITLGSNASDTNSILYNSSSLSYTNTGVLTATSMSAGSFTATSLRAKKENISTFTASALDIIDSTEVVSYNFIEDQEKTYKIGFIADDTHEFLSSKEHDKMDINNSIGLLLKAIQELRAENKELRSLVEGK